MGAGVRNVFLMCVMVVGTQVHVGHNGGRCVGLVYGMCVYKVKKCACKMAWRGEGVGEGEGKNVWVGQVLFMAGRGKGCGTTIAAGAWHVCGTGMQ